MHRIRMVVILGLALVFGASKVYPQANVKLEVFPPSALRGEVVMLARSDQGTIGEVKYGPTADTNFRPSVTLTPLTNCPSYLVDASPYKAGTPAVCVKIPDSWGGPQQLSDGSESVAINVFGQNVPSPIELQESKRVNLIAGRGWVPPVRDLRKAFILWFPGSLPAAERVLSLKDILSVSSKTARVQIKGFEPSRYEFQYLTENLYLGGLSGIPERKNICNGYIRVVGFNPPSDSEERLGFVLEQVKKVLQSVAGSDARLEAYGEMNGDPVPGYSTPAAKPADDATPNLTPNSDVKTGTNTGVGTTIAILDSGVTPNNSLFGNRILSIGLGNFANWNWVGGSVTVPTGTGTTDDDFSQTIRTPGGVVSKKYGSHGTAAAALAAGNGMGVAPAADILPVKVCQSNGICTLPGVIQGACYALKNGGDPKKLVLNMSLGGDTPSAILSGILQNATELGVPVVASVGNEWNRRQDHLGRLNHYPADARDATDKPIAGVIGAGALGRFPELAPANFSHEGTYLDVFAPGVKSVVNIPTTIPGATNEYDGTSFSAPIVAGALALSRETDSTSNAAKLEQNIKALTCATPGKTKDTFDTSYGKVPLLDLPCVP